MKKLKKYKQINKSKSTSKETYTNNLNIHYGSKHTTLPIKNSKNINYTIHLDIINKLTNKLGITTKEVDNIDFFNIKEYIKKYSTEEIYYSLKHEGINATRNNIKTILLEKQNKEKTFMEIDKLIINMDSCLSYIINNKISINSIFGLYATITNEISTNLIEEDKFYRQKDVFIGEHKGFDPSIISQKISELVYFINNSKINIEIKAIISHVVFERIHPYYDYNGRIGRLIHLWILLEKKEYNIFKKYRFLSTAIYNYRKIFEKSFDDLTYSATFDCDFNLTHWVGNFIKIIDNNSSDYLEFLIKYDGQKISINAKIVILLIIKNKRYHEKRWYDLNFIYDTLGNNSKTTAYRVLEEIKKLDSFEVIDSKPIKFRIND